MSVYDPYSDEPEFDRDAEDRVFNRVMSEIDAEDDGKFFKGMFYALVATLGGVFAIWVIWRITWH